MKQYVFPQEFVTAGIDQITALYRWLASLLIRNQMNILIFCASVGLAKEHNIDFGNVPILPDLIVKIWP